MIEWFEVTDINKGAARFDFQKLEALNGVHMRQMDDRELTKIFLDTLPYLEGGNEFLAKLDDTRREQLVAAMPGLKERAKTLVELLDSSQFLFADRPLVLDEKAAALLNDEARGILSELVADFEALTEWTAESTDAVVRAYAEKSGRKLGKVAQPLRAALCGRTTSPGIFDVLAVLGRDESLGRIRDQL